MAKPELRRAVSAKPSDANANYCLGRLLYSKNWFDESFQYTQRAIALDSTLIRAYDNLGLCYEAKQMYGEAKTPYLQGITREPNSGGKIEWPALDLGIMLPKNELVARAKPYLQEALVINPDSAEAHFRFGSSLEKEGELTNTTRGLVKATELDPKLAPAHYRLGQIYRKLGKTAGDGKASPRVQTGIFGKRTVNVQMYVQPCSIIKP